MKSRSNLLLVLLILIIPVLMAASGSFQTSKTAKQQWEYKTVSLNYKVPETSIQKYGANGWELVAVTLYSDETSSYKPPKYTLFFKRPLIK